MRAILGVNVNIAARRCRLRPCHPDLCEGKGGAKSGRQTSNYRDGNNFSHLIAERTATFCPLLDQSRPWSKMAMNGSVVNDPKRTTVDFG